MKIKWRSTLTLTAALTLSAGAQVKTETPPVVPGAKPVTAERIKVHGLALEGNLEGNSADREVIGFRPRCMRIGESLFGSSPPRRAKWC